MITSKDIPCTGSDHCICDFCLKAEIYDERLTKEQLKARESIMNKLMIEEQRKISLMSEDKRIDIRLPTQKINSKINSIAFDISREFNHLDSVTLHCLFDKAIERILIIEGWNQK